jgi:hypothetical protein
MNRRLKVEVSKPLLQIFSCVIFTVSDHWVSYIPWFRFDHGVDRLLIERSASCAPPLMLSIFGYKSGGWYLPCFYYCYSN